ncbi:MAG: ATP-binding cassette domain-containing protein, partial [Propionibacteriaceae bacterium]|nr:ATP-binding cassette domain-containing protein [Propionibacteriaceae bacterium]
MNSGRPLVSLTGVSKTVTGNIQALRDATTVIYPDDLVAVVGPSGSGKTTLLSILGLLDTATAGEYLFDDVNVAELAEDSRNELRSRRVGFVFQNSYLNADESVGENVALGLRVRGVALAEQTPLVAAALAQVGLAGFENRRAGDLSGGEKQRVAVARALVTAPDLLLADEPTGALDSTSTAALVELLQEISSHGTAVVVVTHDPIVGAATKRVLEIHDGVVSEPHPVTPADSIGTPFEKGASKDDNTATPNPQTPTQPDNHSPLSQRGWQAQPDGGFHPTPPPTHTTHNHHQQTPADSVGTPFEKGASTDAKAGDKGTTRTARMLEVFDALKTPLLRPLRSALVLLAYVLGITSLTASLALTQSATGSIVERLTEAASNEIRVTTTESDSSFLLDPTLSDGAVSRLQKLEGVDTVVPVRTFGPQSNGITRALPASPNSAPTILPGRIFVTEASYLFSYGFEAASGRIDLLSNSWAGLTVILGSAAAENLNV